MRKSIKRQYELDRHWDFEERNSAKERKFIKRRAHKRFRKFQHVSGKEIDN